MFTREQLQEMIDGGEYLGEGIARVVFRISDKMVLKVNSRRYRLEQSQTELAFYKKWYNEFNDILPECYGYLITMDEDDYEDYIYMFMEQVTPLDFEEMEYEDVYDYITSNYEFDIAQEMCERIEFFEAYTTIADSSNNETNWGVRDDGSIVLLDCGMVENNREELCACF